jgi:hypothetical protein
MTHAFINHYVSALGTEHALVFLLAKFAGGNPRVSVCIMAKDLSSVVQLNIPAPEA